MKNNKTHNGKINSKTGTKMAKVRKLEKKSIKVKKDKSIKKKIVKNLETNGSNLNESNASSASSKSKKNVKENNNKKKEVDKTNSKSSPDKKVKKSDAKLNKKPTKKESKVTKKKLTNNSKVSSKTKQTAKSKTKKSIISKEQKSLMAMLENDAIRPRGPRLASLNASCKMQLLYEVDRFQGSSVSSSVTDSDQTDEETTVSNDKSKQESKHENGDQKSSNSKKDNSNNWNSSELLTDDESELEKDTEEESDSTENDSDETDQSDTEAEDKRSKIKADLRKKKTLTKGVSSKKPKITKSSNKSKESPTSKKNDKNIKSNGQQNSKNSSSNKKVQVMKKEMNKDKSNKSKEKVVTKRGRKPKEKDSKIIKKRKIKEDPSVQLIDTRSCKRMASLNASAMMAASMQNEKPMSLALVKSTSPVPFRSEHKSKSDLNNYDQDQRSRVHADSVEVIRETKTTVYGQNEMTETIERIKQVRQMSSSSIEEGGLSIEMLDPSHPNASTDASIEHLDNGIVEEPSSDEDVEEATCKKNDLKKKKNSQKRCDPGRHANKDISSMTTTSTTTTTTKVKINKRRSAGDKNNTTVEQIEYEVQHGAFNPFGSSAVAQSVSSLRSAAANQVVHSNPAPKSLPVSNAAMTNSALISLAQQSFSPTAYGLGPPGYCFYPAYGGNPMDLAYANAANAAHIQNATNVQNVHASLPNNVCPSFMPNMVPPVIPSSNPSTSMMNANNDNRSPPNVSYKSAFSVPQTTSSTATNTTSSPSSASSPFSPRLNGIYQLPDNSLLQTVNDQSYLIHKPVAFNAATGSPIFATSNAQFRPSSVNPLGPIIQTSQPNTINAQTPPMMHPAMSYLPPSLMPSPYIFQYASPLNSSALAAAATGFNHPLIENPYMQSNGLVTQIATDLSQMVNTNTPGAALNIAFIPGLHNQLNNLNTGLPNTPFFPTNQPSVSINSPNPMSSNIFSAVPNLARAAVVTAGQSTAAANPNIDQQPDIQLSSNVKATSKKSISTKSNKSKLNSKNLSHFKNESKKSSTNESLVSNGTKSNESKTSVKLVSINDTNVCQNNTFEMNKSDVQNSNSNLSNSSITNQSSSTFVKTKPFAVGIRKNRNLKKSKTLSISGCSIEVGTSGQTSTTLPAATIVKNQSSFNNTNSMATKSYLPALAPEPEPSNSILNFKKKSIPAQNWISPKLNESEKGNSKVPVTTIYLSEQSQTNLLSKSGLKNSKNGTTMGSLNNQNSINSNALTITPLSVSNAKEASSGNNGKSSNGKISKKASNNLSVGKSTSPVDVLIVSAGKQINDSLKSNGSSRSGTVLTNKQSTSLTTVVSTKDNKQNMHSGNVSHKKHTKNLVKSNRGPSLHHSSNPLLSTTCQSASSSNHYSSSSATSSNSTLLSHTVSIKTPFCSPSDSNLKSSNSIVTPIPAAHGWKWEGKPTKKFVVINPDEAPQPRLRYPRIKHSQGDVISEGDCVLLRSGAKCTDLPFVAKISALWEEPSTKAMMMSLFWYYRPEHTGRMCNVAVRAPTDSPSYEIYASKHRDVNSVACIDDKCHVLTFAQFCRYRRLQKMYQSGITNTLADRIVPQTEKSFQNQRKALPPLHLSNETVLCCRRVYDFRQKRLLKNPT